MTVRLTASVDARQPLAFCRSDKALVGSRARRNALRGVKRLLSFTTGLSLGVSIAIASANAAAAPASGSLSLTDFFWPQAQTAPAPAAPPVAPIPVAPIPVAVVPTPDPLESFVPVAPADTGDIRASIINEISAPSRTSARVVATRSVEQPEEYVNFDGMRVPRRIVDAILRASEVTGADPVYMMALADKESSFIASNEASTSSAVGLFQFISSTWFEVIRSFGEQHGFGAEVAAIRVVGGQLTVTNAEMRTHILGLRRNPYVSALMAAEMMKRDRAKIEGRLGRQITRSEFYFSHFFGVDSASKFMVLVHGKPKQSASRVFPAAARANKSLFYAKKGRKTRQLTVTEVYKKIDGMIDRRLERYEDVSALATADAAL